MIIFLTIALTTCSNHYFCSSGQKIDSVYSYQSTSWNSLSMINAPASEKNMASLISARPALKSNRVRVGMSSVLVGVRYRLSWRAQERKDSTSSVKIRSTSGRKGGDYIAEFGVRKNMLTGCVIVDPSQGDLIVESECFLDRGNLVIKLGRSKQQGASMLLNLTSNKSGIFEGSALMRAPIFPIDINIGTATMQVL